MECMQTKALRPSLCGELSPNEFVDEVFYNTATHTAVSCVSSEDSLVDEFVDEVFYNMATHTAVSCVSSEDSLVDEFLDLQNVEFEEKEEGEEEGDGKCSLSFDHENSNLSCAFSESQLASELAVPDDDIAGLEWVSHFVDDSLSEFPPYNLINNNIRPPNRVEPVPVPVPVPSKPVFAQSYSSIPVKPRTKRSRPATTRPSILSPLSESSSSSSSSSSPSSLGFGFSPSLLFAVPQPERKKPRRKYPAVIQAGPMFQRRCSHCQVQKTPQWRTGPLGAKTLCNACGVRFKSGRLFPEYRPACSPTFSSEVHSNSHRKVVEMRKKKEVLRPGSGSESGFNHIISSF